MTRLDSFFALALLFAAGCSSTSVTTVPPVFVDAADAGAPFEFEDAGAFVEPDGAVAPSDASHATPDTDASAETHDAGTDGGMPDSGTASDAGRDSGPVDSGPPPPPPCAADGFEPNDTDATARPLGTARLASVRMTVDASWSPTGDVDTYRLRVERSTGSPVRFTVDTLTPGAMVSLRFECDSMVRRCAAGPGAGLPWGSCEVSSTSGRAVLDVECWDPDDPGNLFVSTAHASECRYALWLDAQPIPHVSAP